MHHRICPDIATSHCFFSRADGVSTGLYEGLNCGPGSDDDPANIAKNRAIAAGLLSGERTTPVLSCYQVHGSDVVTVGDDWASLWAAERPKADAMVTNQPGVILGILTADCCPILFEDATAGVIGAAHAGWQGAFKGVAENTVAAMERLGADRARIHAAIGPTIAQASYEVSADFRQKFCDTDASFARFFKVGRDDAHAQFDLPAFVSSRLADAAIASVWDTALDTYTSLDHFSFRRTTHRQEADYGRQLSAIMLRA